MNTKLTFKEIEDILYKKGITPSSFDSEEFEYEIEIELVNEIGEWKKVDSYGGTYSGGSDWYTVYFFTQHDIYIRIEGYYSSYDGIDYVESYKEVFPVEVTKIEYLPAK